MNIHSLIPLVATVAYIPLLALLLANRPWTRQQQIFVIFLTSVMLWSFGDFLFRSDYLNNEKIILAKGILCVLTLGVTQLHHYLKSFYDKRNTRFPLAYMIMGICFIMILLFMPQDLIKEENIVPVYGPWIYPLAAYCFLLLSWDILQLVRRIRRTMDPVVHNQIFYLLVGLAVLIVFAITAFTPLGREYPLAHVGNFINAVILSYTVARHRLLDMHLVLRRGLTLLSMVAAGLVIFLFIYLTGHFIFKFELAEMNLLVGIALAILIVVVVFQTRTFMAKQVDKLIYRDSYVYRQQLTDFTRNRIKGILNLDEMGNELLSLMSGAIRFKLAFLLLPQAESGDFYIRFSIPPQQDRPSFILKADSPIIHWLNRENSYLPREKIEIEPEFKGLWKEEKESINRLNIQMFFPISSRGKIVGLLALGEKQSNRRYTLEDINFCEGTIVNIAVSLEKEYLQEQLRKREQELSIVSRLSSVITSSLNIDTVYEAFVEELKEVVQVNYASIHLIENNEVFVAAVSSDVGPVWRTQQKIPMANTATEWVVLNKRLYYETDLSKNKRFSSSEEYLKRNIRSMVYLPLINKGEVSGVLNIGSINSEAYNLEQLILLQHLASQIAAPIENSRLFSKTEQIARVDALTDLFNRRHFDERMNEEINRHARYGDVLSILFLDLDNFKKYNDTFGHLAGDRMLMLAADVIKTTIRFSDLAFRYGGDEFAVILPNSSPMDAFSVAERIREKIALEMNNRQQDITVSIGVASWPGDGSTLDELCNAADMALYYAKRTGENRTSIASRTLFSLNEATSSAKNEADVLSTIYALAATLEARDKYTYGHSRRVSRYAVATAEAMNLPPETVAAISAAALLHDIGKVGVPDSVLNKDGELMNEEMEMLRQHPRLSATILGHIPSLNACMAAVRHHHERWDGGGYPSGLMGEDIPIEARILTVTDSFEAMISARPYRKALTFKQAISELKKCSGSQFDPKVVQAFIPIALSIAPGEMDLELEKVRHRD